MSKDTILFHFLLMAIFCGLSISSNGQPSAGEDSNSNANATSVKNNFSHVLANDPYSLHLKSGSFIPEANFQGAYENKINNDAQLLVLQFRSIPSWQEQNQMESMGLDFEDYLPNKAYLVYTPEGFSFDKLSNFGVRAILPFSAKFKVNKDFTGQIPDHARKGNMVRLSILSNSRVTSQEIIQAISQLEGQMVQLPKTGNLYSVDIPESRINDLIELKQIKWIEYIEPDPVPDDLRGRSLHRANAIDVPSATGYHYDGTGVSVALADDGPVGPHIDLEGRVVQVGAMGADGTHGDMTVGILMGAGNLNPNFAGMATGVQMRYYDIFPPGGPSYDHINSAVPNYNNFGTVITSTSYSEGSGGNYTSTANAADQQIHQNPSIIHVFSAGNAGPGYSTITGGRKAAKNTIATANLEYQDVRTNSSSRGPAADGRVKPDISANGTNQMSLDANNGYSPGGGTSAACPGIAGVLSQLYQAYRDLNAGADPASSLMKAVLLNSAEDLGNPGPDYSFGWGRVDALRAFKTLEENRIINSSVFQGDSMFHSITVPAGVGELKVMVYWLDRAGAPSANPALVSNLDISLTDPTNTTWQPWVLNPSSPTANATRGVDNLNNVEQVTLNAPAAGSYSLKVKGTTVPFGAQGYHVVYEFRMNEPKITYPIGGEPFVAGELQTIRWDALDDTQSFTLEYSLDSGVNWSPISSAVSGSQRYYDWIVPQVVTGDALVRVTQGSSSSTSIAPFSIINVPQNLNVRWACTDSLYLEWDSVAGADSYEVSMLGTQYMDSIDITTDNNYILRNINGSNSFWFSVKAMNQAQSIVGQRALAIEKAPGTFSCPVPSDVSVAAMISPQNAQVPSCQDLDSVTVTVRIENVGSTREGNFPVTVELNSGATSTLQFTDTLEVFEARNITFPVLADMSSGNSHLFKAWTDLANDNQRQNDTSTAVVTVYAGNPVTFPHTQNFDQFALCATTANCAGTTCNLGGGWINQTNGFGDDIDWRVWNTSTPSGGTGPSSDHTGSGNFIYLEASGNPVCADRTAVLLSPCMDLSFAQQPELSFWYHMQGSAIGELHVDILADGVWTEDIMTPLIGQQGPSWQQANVDLSPYLGKVINLRFRGITGNDFASDIALDDIEVLDNFVYAIDGSISSLITPSFTTKEDCLLPDSLEVMVEILNAGANSIGNLPLKYSINNGPAVSATYSSVLVPGAVDTFAFSNYVSLPGVGTYHLRVWNDYSLDMNAGNDTAHNVMTITPGVLFGLPFTQTFDAFGNCATTSNCEATVCSLQDGWKNYSNAGEDDIDWRVNNGNTPSNGTGPSNDQNLGTSAGKYLYLEVSNGCNNRTAVLESPCIDLSSSFSPQLSMWYHMSGLDMGELHFDVFLGDNWIEDFVPPIIGNQGNNWQQWNIDLTLLAGNIISFRIRGISDVGFRGDMAIDNFSITEGFTAAQADFTFTQPTCAGQSITFTDNSLGSLLNYSWDFGPNATPSTATGVGPHTVFFTKSGIQDVALVASNIAGSDTSTQTLLLDTLPMVNFAWNVQGTTVDFSNQSSNATTYSWDFGDGNTSTDFQPTHTYAANGIYTVTLTVGNGCGNNIISYDVNVGVTGMSEDLENGILAYPNPNKGLLTIRSNKLSKKEEAFISITDMRGVNVYQNTHFLSEAELQLDIRELANGLYILMIQSESVNTVMKIEKD